MKETFQAVKEVSNKDGVEKIVAHYFNTDQKNLGLFFYVTEVSSEVNKLVDEKNKIKEDIAKLEVETGATERIQEIERRHLEVNG